MCHLRAVCNHVSQGQNQSNYADQSASTIGFVSLLIGQESGANFVRKSRREVKPNQGKHELLGTQF